MLYKAENISFCGGLQFQDFNAQKITATRELWLLKFSTLKVKNIITGNETWVYGYDVETKMQSSQWMG